MHSYEPHDDAKAILLLCARMGAREADRVKPLTLTEYNGVAEWLHSRALVPRDLLGAEGSRALEDTSCPQPTDRMKTLLGRGMALAVDLQHLSSQGIWVVCRSDHDYPKRLKQHLRHQAPAFLYGVGNKSLLEGGGLAIVGSRNVDEPGLRFTQKTATQCAAHGMRVVSGGARGVDQTAMRTALAAGGQVIGILADSMAKTMKLLENRSHLLNGTLLLLTPYHPAAAFSVGNAMGRNKLIHAMADYSLIVAAEHEKGGTWAGAMEELKRPAHRPVFVRDAAPATGNAALRTNGALPFPHEFLTETPDRVLRTAAEVAVLHPEVLDTPAILDITPDPYAGIARVAEKVHMLTTQKKKKTGTPEAKTKRGTKKREVGSTPGETLSAQPDEAKKTVTVLTETDSTSGSIQQHHNNAKSPGSILEAVTPLILGQLSEPITSEELSSLLGVQPTQMKHWLMSLVEQKLVVKLNKPVRYRRVEQQQLHFG